ncbi:hypothetical protein CASFOL_029479 [Castilleja foliolosa]|uniref:Tetratricopeptide repeat protein n=1 Tax=Castilleja foliolosa TaxID=1961234 RepID=A0ABD3CAB0_9LAMI
MNLRRRKRGYQGNCVTKRSLDSFLVIGESYHKLRKFSKAFKWFQKGWETYREIGSLEGQALAKINIGEVLYFSGDWAGALDAFQKGHKQVPSL